MPWPRDTYVYNENPAKKKQKKNVVCSDDFRLTPLQLETRFRGQNYLDLV